MSHDTRPIKEERVKEHVKRLLKKYATHFFMPVQSGYGSQSLDFLCCHKGRFFAVETKAPGKHLTARQELIRDMIERAGGTVFVVGEQALYWTGEDKNGLGVRKKLKTFTGMEALEGWLLLGR